MRPVQPSPEAEQFGPFSIHHSEPSLTGGSSWTSLSAGTCFGMCAACAWERSSSLVWTDLVWETTVNATTWVSGAIQLVPLRVAWHNNAMLLFASCHSVNACAEPQKPSTASTTSPTLIGRRKCIKKSKCFSCGRSLAQEGSGLDQTTAGVLHRELPHTPAFRPAFPEPF